MQTAIEVVRQQFQDLHGFLRTTLAGCDQETAAAAVDGAAILPIATIAAHILMSEDGMVNTWALDRPPLAVRGGWAERLGVPADEMPTLGGELASRRPDIEALRQFEQALAADVAEGLAAVTDERLATEVDTPVGTQDVLGLLAGISLQHIALHTGEISALRGVRGQQVLPF